MIEGILEGLNPPQREAVCHTEGPLLVLAGAGSGKTRVIAHRIAHLLAGCGLHPSQILAVTFTNKAAEEMARRVADLLLPFGFVPPLIATFHSTCVRILRQEIHHLGGKRDFVIYDEEDRLTLMKEIMRGLALDERALPPAVVVHRISQAKNQLQDPQALAAEAGGPREERVAEVYRRYQSRLGEIGALDFDDLLAKTVELFERCPEVLSRYRDRWRYVLVDEYQDTNHAQYRLICLLVAEHWNLCVVGDDDQSVYRWRGADLRNILDFERDFPDCRVVRLEQNYRSTKRILEIAGGVIAHNLGRKGKTLWTENDEGERAACYRAWDETEEAAFVAEMVSRLRRDRGVDYREVAIFYRINAQSRVLEDRLRRSGIPYVIVGGVRFYERREIKDALSYLRLIVNPADDLAFRRAIGVPARGIGKTTLQRLEVGAARSGRSLLEACASLTVEEIPARQRQTLREFAGLFDRLRAKLSVVTLPDFVQAALEESGLLEVLRQEKTVEAEERLKNLQELVSATEEFTEKEAGGLSAFLDSVALISDVDEWKPGGSAVTLMTVHSAKGLEFPVVFLTGLEEGVFPYARSLEDEEELEEERRLCYVGMTRAKRLLFLSYALHRRLHGAGEWSEPSRFLMEIPQGALVYLNGEGSARAVTVPTVHESEVAYGDDLPVRVGQRVRHPRFGEGLVVGIEGTGSDVIVSVAFGSVGRRRLALQYANLETL
ncbi:MAG: UvrD-helicase domain-containing protein [Candidatus Rokubacteria bacterium]|nr:UvrD-helicase domain-containing protein [Candidatus Rokubacteria bacterium]